MAVSFYPNTRAKFEDYKKDNPKSEVKIVARITWSRTGLLKYSTGVAVPVKQWDNKRKFIRDTDIGRFKLKSQRERLEKIKSLAEDGILDLGRDKLTKDQLRTYIECNLQGESAALKKKLQAFTDFMENKIDNDPWGKKNGKHIEWSAGTIKNKKQSLAALKAFEEYRSKRIGFEEIKEGLYMEFRNYFLDVNETSKNTFGRIIKDFKSFVNYAKKESYPIPNEYIATDFYVFRIPKQNPVWFNTGNAGQTDHPAPI